MNARKLPKFKLEKVNGSNLGHTKDEWGKQEDTPKNRIIEAHDLKWNIDTEIDD
ncbi:MAG: hypothetical protein IIB80_07725 [Thaumarchaeota archaeon]|nr:hypothetical protein [Nitrososphaerota archaeon]